MALYTALNKKIVLFLNFKILNWIGASSFQFTESDF